MTPTMIANAGRAYKAGVKIAFGTDQGATSNRNKAEEFALADITELQRVQFVMKGGEIVKRDGKMQR